MAGRKPIPSALSLVRGNPGHRPINEDEPKPKTPSQLRCPAGMSKFARKEYRRVAKFLIPLGILTEADTRALEVYAEAFAQWRDAMAKVADEGMVLITGKGYPIQNPHLTIANAAAKRMLLVLAEFGMTPSSRSRLTVGQTSPERESNKFSDLG